ncbi:MAG TPA: PEP/pyruvate-binding domain-containing protein [Candidatus Polarisedimenticolia bacterium]|nr:PEP/pyruvate-binding domain-containing protein [Candidatus Polarisedimenticolia bacterium]
MDRWTRTLRQIRPRDATEVGGKALGLARLAALNLPVPPTFVIVASLFEEVRSRLPDEPEIETIAGRIPASVRASIESARDRLGEAPGGYAVRSSAAEEDGAKFSFAGVHESFLGIPREEVVGAAFRCWASAFSDRALAYRRRMGLSTDASAIRMAVVVQPMLRPSSAGVLFTATSDSAEGELLIHAVAGTAERLVKGETEPWALRLPRRPGAKWIVPEGSPLSAKGAEELASLALRAASEWGMSLDIEWAMEGDRLCLLQARPVTAPLPGPEETPAPADDVLWTRANLRELLPDLPSPFFLSLMERMDWVAANRRLGLPLDPGDQPVVRIIEGRPYFNLSRMGNAGARFGFPLSRFARALGHGADLTGIPEVRRLPLAGLLASPRSGLRLLRINLTSRGEVLRFFDRVHTRLRRLQEVKEVAAPDRVLLDLSREAEAHGADFLYVLQIAFLRVVSRMMAVELMVPSATDPERFINATVAAGDKSVSVRQGLDLVFLAHGARSEGRVVQYLVEGWDDFREWERELEGTHFLGAFRDYLARYGHRGVQESDPAMPLYAEDPGFLLKAIGRVAGNPRSPDPEATLRTQAETASSAWRDLWKRLSILERVVPVRVFLLRRAISSLRKAMALREEVRFEGMRVQAEHRRFLREVGQRFVRRGILEWAEDVCFLRAEEIEGALDGRGEGEDFRDTVHRRRKEMDRQREIPMPNLLRESEIPGLSDRSWTQPRDEGSFLGLPVGPGKVEGIVRVLEGPQDMDLVHPGDILVAPTLDPSWIPLFALASGLVVEMGGTLSHGSIIAREYGLPTVVNIPGITRALKTGDRILLDGSAGVIRRLGEQESPKEPKTIS